MTVSEKLQRSMRIWKGVCVAAMILSFVSALLSVAAAIYILFVSESELLSLLLFSAAEFRFKPAMGVWLSRALLSLSDTVVLFFLTAALHRAVTDGFFSERITDSFKFAGLITICVPISVTAVTFVMAIVCDFYSLNASRVIPSLILGIALLTGVRVLRYGETVKRAAGRMAWELVAARNEPEAQQLQQAVPDGDEPFETFRARRDQMMGLYAKKADQILKETIMLDETDQLLRDAIVPDEKEQNP